MRAFLAISALLSLAACGQSGGEKASGVAAGGGNSATITEGTIDDAMIDLSESESYGVTSTIVEAPAEPKDGAEKTAEKPKSASKPKADEAKESPASAPEPKSEDADAE